MKRTVLLLFLMIMVFSSCKRERPVLQPQGHNRYSSNKAASVKDSQSLENERVEQIIRHIDTFSF